jgi:L-fuconolactonase
VVELFGTDRIMTGSDWPVCRVAGEYEKVMAIVEEYFQGFSEQEKEQIFGENCRAFYQLPDQKTDEE